MPLFSTASKSLLVTTERLSTSQTEWQWKPSSATMDTIHLCERASHLENRMAVGSSSFELMLFGKACNYCDQHTFGRLFCMYAIFNTELMSLVDLKVSLEPSM